MALPPDEANPWTVKKKTVRFETPWIRVVENEVIDPAGQPAMYGTVHFRHRAVGVLAIDDEGYTWLVGQHRFPIDRYSWEIPEGGAKEGEDLLAAAQRELEEETGMRARRWTRWFETTLSNSVTDEHATVFLAQELEPGVAKPDATERLRVHRLPLRDAFALLQEGKIEDVISVATLWRARAENLA